VVARISNSSWGCSKACLSQEFKMRKTLTHANLAPFLGGCSTSQFPYVLYEMAAQGSLRQVLHADGAATSMELTPSRRVRLARDAAAGVAYLHEHKYTLQWLDSQSCVVTADWQAQISDLSLAIPERNSGGGYSQRAIARTQTELLFRQNSRMGPAPLSTLSRTASDVWSLGSLLWEAWSSSYPANFDASLPARPARPYTMPGPLHDVLSRCWPREGGAAAASIEASAVAQVLSQMIDSDDALALDGFPLEMFECASEEADAHDGAHGAHHADQELVDDLQCGVCRNVMKDPMTVPCGHSFCSYCITAWMQMGSSSSCPCCRADVAKNQVNKNLALRSIIDRQTVSCQVCLAAAQKATAEKKETATATTAAAMTHRALETLNPAAAAATAAAAVAALTLETCVPIIPHAAKAEARPAAPGVPSALTSETAHNAYIDENGDVVGSALIEITRIASMKRKDKPAKADVLELLQNVLQEQRAPLDSQTLNNTDLGKLRFARESRRTIRKNLSRFRRSTASSLGGKSSAGKASGIGGNNSDNDSDYDEVELYAHIDSMNELLSQPQPPMVVGFVSAAGANAGAGAGAGDVVDGDGDGHAAANSADVELQPPSSYDLLSDDAPPVPVVWRGSLHAWRSHMREEHSLWVASPPGHVFSGPVTTAAESRRYIPNEDFYHLELNHALGHTFNANGTYMMATPDANSTYGD